MKTTRYVSTAALVGALLIGWVMPAPAEATGEAAKPTRHDEKLERERADPDDDNVGTRDLEHIGSFQFRYDSDLLGIRFDLTGGIGYLGQSDLVGLALVPFVHVTPTVMLVGRYTHLHSFEDGGIRFKSYDNEVESDRGERYDEFFLGANWFLYGHRLKLQTGGTYTRMDDLTEGGDYEGFGWTVAVRMSW